MKIGITCHPSAGGSGIVATDLGIALAERGHTVHFVTSEAPFRLTQFHPNVHSHVVSQISYPLFRQPPGGLTLAAKIADVADQYDIDLWHAHYAIPNAASAILARSMLLPEKTFKVVTTLHGTDITLVGADPSFYRVTRYAMEQSDAVTAVSNWLRDATQTEFSLTRSVRTIYNFIDPAKYREIPSHRCNLALPDEKIIMHISNFRPVKRVTDVVRAFKRVLDQVPARLVMIGDGPEKISADGVARQLGIADKIKHLGVVEDIETVLPCADIVFQPSEHESFGLVPLEAMACGIPVIATASGGITEVVQHNLTGYLCEVGDIETMARYAIGLLANPQQARQMGQQGRKRAVDMFSKDQRVKEYETLYQELLET
jgi:N-acetyl-alpha-D-glucosaminyl L-malate synthase BshA